MIIRSLAAENLLKYRVLELGDLPETGIIAVSGANETGKSAIGELICFALFGRTYAIPAEAARKLVRWGAGRGSLTLRFSAGGRDWEVSRGVERDGTLSARLADASDPGEPLARGSAEVNDRLARILGYGFDEYIETFYLAQREIQSPHPLSPAIKSLSGVAALEKVDAELAGELAAVEAGMGELQGRIQETERGLSALGGGHLRIAELEQEYAALGRREREAQGRLAALESAQSAYRSAWAGQRGFSVRRGFAGLVLALLLLVSLAVGGVWGLIRYRPELWPVPSVRGHLEAVLAGTGVPVEAALLYAAIALIGALTLVWLWALALDLGARRRYGRGRQLANELQRLEDLEPATLRAPAARSDDGPAVGEPALEGAAPVDRPDPERRSRLEQRVRDLSAAPDEVAAAVSHESAWLNRLAAELATRRAVLDESLSQARSERERSAGLRQTREQLARQLAERRSQVENLRLARSLLDGAAESLSEGFNEGLRETLTRALPMLTEGRYEHPQVDRELKVRVYSGEKRGFLDLDETSSGTQRQVMLALRLALAEELITRVVREPQFAFLDEPFAFFDEARMRSALKVLPQLSERMVQHWVVAQRFSGDAPIALEIPCGRHPDTLRLGRAVLS